MPARIFLALMLGISLPACQQDEPPLTAEGAEQDGAKDLSSLKMQAEQGNAEAQLNLGTQYAAGEKVPQDYEEAVRWYRMAAEQGYAKAQSQLAAMYLTGQGVPKDYEETVRWARAAVEQGEARAQLQLGFMYDAGLAVPQDDVQAHMWYSLAASNFTGDEAKAAADSRDMAAKKMSPEDLAEAQRLAREWKPKGSGSP